MMWAGTYLSVPAVQFWKETQFKTTFFLRKNAKVKDFHVKMRFWNQFLTLLLELIQFCRLNRKKLKGQKQDQEQKKNHEN